MARGRPAGRALRAPARAARQAMAGERTRRFTRSLLRPGQAAELRHSAASAAAVAVSSRQQQRVSVACSPRLPARPGRPGAPSPASPSAQRAPPAPSRVPSARQRHRRFPARGARGVRGHSEAQSVGDDVCGFGGWGGGGNVSRVTSALRCGVPGTRRVGGLLRRSTRGPPVSASPSPLATGAQRGRDVTLRSSLRPRLGAPR